MITNTYTNDDVDCILTDFRILAATVDTVAVRLTLAKPAQYGKMLRISSASGGYGMEFCPVTGRRIMGGNCWRQWKITFQNPTATSLREAMGKIDERWEILENRVTRVDVAFDAKRKGIRKDLPVPDELVLGSARHDLIGVYLSCLGPLKKHHDWKRFSGNDGTSTLYLGSWNRDFFRLYDKHKDQKKMLAPVDRVARLEVSLRPQTVADLLETRTVEDLVQFDQWRRVLWLFDLVDRDEYVLRGLKDRLGKSLDRLTDNWTDMKGCGEGMSYKENAIVKMPPTAGPAGINGIQLPWKSSTIILHNGDPDEIDLDVSSVPFTSP